MSNRGCRSNGLRILILMHGDIRKADATSEVCVCILMSLIRGKK